MSPAHSSARRVTAIAVNTVRESMRQRFIVLLTLTAAALGVAAWWLRDCSVVASREKFLLDAGFGALTFFGAVVAIVAAAESFSSEIERRPSWPCWPGLCGEVNSFWGSSLES